MKIKNPLEKILLLFFLISLASSLIISIVPLPLICTPSEGCSTVQNSHYAKTFGIKNEYYGDILLLGMSLLIISDIIKPTRTKKTVIKSGVYLGTLTALYFIYLQIFVIHAFCKYCLVIDFSMIASFIIISIPEPERKRKPEEKINFSIEGN